MAVAKKNTDIRQGTADRRKNLAKDQSKALVVVGEGSEAIKPTGTKEYFKSPKLSKNEVIKCPRMSKANMPLEILFNQWLEVEPEKILELYPRCMT